MAGALAARLNLRHVELDAIHWEPDWTPAPDNLILSRTMEATAEPGWVVDGNYGRLLRDHNMSNANTIVWLDFPLTITLPRCLKRSWTRWRSQELLWGNNRERFWKHFLPWDDSLIWWNLKRHYPRQRQYAANMTNPRWSGKQFHRLRTPKQAEYFLHHTTLTPDFTPGRASNVTSDT